jgi:acyl-CoA dehydrogenase
LISASRPKSRVRPAVEKAEADGADRKAWRRVIGERRKQAKEWELWLPHLPKEWGGMGLGPTAMAAVSAEAAKTGIGPFFLSRRRST